MSEREIDPSSIRICERCGNPKMTISGKLACVHCSSEDNTRVAPFRNDIEDPGHEATIKVLAGATPKDVPEIRIMVPPSDATLLRTDTTGTNTIVIHQWPTEPTQEDVSKALEMISLFFQKQPISDLQTAKKLLKLRQEIRNLQVKLLNFLGGN